MVALASGGRARARSRQLPARDGGRKRTGERLPLPHCTGAQSKMDDDEFGGFEAAESFEDGEMGTQSISPAIPWAAFSAGK
ncbi:hypothetical protein scyTo_0009060 [Scyliorhinus torazame]|uniref:Uncharacterized protein n=1 Tax=Scyliorhinus torazame TaxID=75743 RepID=A0A401PGH2_SCYTO|nr:hypothetical protein [Scyliorhinus torazame]